MLLQSFSTTFFFGWCLLLHEMMKILQRVGVVSRQNNQPRFFSSCWRSGTDDLRQCHRHFTAAVFRHFSYRQHNTRKLIMRRINVQLSNIITGINALHILSYKGIKFFLLQNHSSKISMLIETTQRLPFNTIPPRRQALK